MSPLGRSIQLAHHKSKRCTSFKLHYTPRWWAKLSGSNCTAHGTEVRPQGVLGFTLYVLWMHYKGDHCDSFNGVDYSHDPYPIDEAFYKWKKVEYGYILIRICQAVSRKCQGKCYTGNSFFSIGCGTYLRGAEPMPLWNQAGFIPS